MFLTTNIEGKTMILQTTTLRPLRLCAFAKGLLEKI